jgi:CRP-like cAMP-binding protein
MPAPELSRRAAMLGTVPLLSGLKRDLLESLAARSSERTVSRGVAIVRAGEMGLGFYLILSGSADVRKEGHTMATLLPGQFFGESALLVAQPRTADVMANSEVRCLTIDRESFWGVFGVDPASDGARLEQALRGLSGSRETLTE